MGGTWSDVGADGGSLSCYVVAGKTASPPAMILCHDFPSPADAASTGQSLEGLADRLAAECGWAVLVGCLRGVGGSSGDFSPRGWYDDLATLVRAAPGLCGTAALWLAGFGVGGSLALCVGADDPAVRGVACLGAPATFADWAAAAPDVVALAERVGVLHPSDVPADPTSWARELARLDPEGAAARLAPRPLLVVHGTEDTVVPPADARALAEAAGQSAELRLLHGAGHRLRADPRAVALLLGWIERRTR